MKPSCDKHPKHEWEGSESVAADDRDIVRATGVTPGSRLLGPPRTQRMRARRSRQAIFAKLKKSPWKLA